MTALTHRPRLPLQPNPQASLTCLLGRLDTIHRRLVARGFRDAVAHRAIDQVLHAGQRLLASGRAQGMTCEQRAGWLWRVALSAARRAAARELAFARLVYDPVDDRGNSRHEDREAVLAAVRGAVAALPEKQRRAGVLHVFQGLSGRAAARQMGIAPSGFFRHYQAALARLEALLSTCRDGRFRREIDQGGGARALFNSEG